MTVLSLKQFLQILQAFCVEQNIPYAYARTYDESIFLSDKTDIDILLKKDDIVHIIKLLNTCSGLTLCDRIDYPTNTILYIYGVEQEKLRYFCLDIHHTLAFKGLSYLNVSAVLLRSAPSAWSIGSEASPLDMGLIYLFTHILKHKTLSVPARIALQRAYKHDRHEFIDLLELYFDTKADAYVSQLLRQEYNLNPIQRLRSAYYRSALQRHGFISLYHMISYYGETIWQRVFNKHDIRIAVIGTDGSGKTTFTQYVREKLINIRPQIVKAHALPTLPGRPEPDSTIVNNQPHSLPSRSWLVSNIKIIGFFCLYWLDALWPRRGNRLIIYDRYFIDVVVDPKRFRFGGSLNLARLLLKCLPRIDAFIWLSTPPLIAFKRKPEVPLAEMQRQYDLYQSFIRSHQNGLSLNGTALSETDMNNLIEQLNMILASRLKQ
jgi:hypothetical protein